VSMRALQTARSALLAHRAAVEVASHNVANVRTPGYARRRLILSSVGTATGSFGLDTGAGVSADTVQRMSDRLLQTQINVESGHLGSAEVMAEGMFEVETVIAGADGQGLLTPLGALFDAFGEIAADPASQAPRNVALARANSLCDAVANADADLRSVMRRNDEQLVADVQQVNRLTAEIAHLNERIAAAGGPGKALEVEDRRTQAVTQMATLCGAVGVPRDNGSIDVLLGGHPIVEYAHARQLELDDDPAWPSLHTVSFKGQTPPAGLDGKIGGYLTVREDGIAAARAEINEFAAQMADAINDVHAGGFGLDGSTAADFFTYDLASPAGTLRISPAIAGNPDSVAAASCPDQPGNGETAMAIEALRTQAAPGSVDSLLQIHANFMATVGSDVSATDATHDARECVVTALQARCDSMSSVSLDEEALALMEAQQAYAAAQSVVEAALSLVDITLQLGQ